MARDAYAYGYLPMIAGVILFSIGNEQVLHKITDPAGGISEKIEGPAVPMLFGGLICYFAVNLLFQLRTLHTVSWTRVGVIVALTVALPIGKHLPALGVLTLAAVICVGLVAVEVLVMSGSRHALRAAVFHERATHEAHEAAWRARWHNVQESDEPTTP
ncbi:low temperature requirement protein A [Micromonospora tarensis]|uniref:low temperature requirement protein A n=1 Tax=Micromonospora tarensis TaxID=2806100 RepID=UPI002104AAF5|nr:low temperature requirement protein A [Micromonospora tarensis]